MPGVMRQAEARLLALRILRRAGVATNRARAGKLCGGFVEKSCLNKAMRMCP
jgi:hypothetical protein